MANDNCTHYWIINSENVGRCKYCPEVRDFGKLLQRGGVFVAAGRGAKARKETLDKKRGTKKKEPTATNAKISAAITKRWQDPEYRARRSARMKAAWQDPEYRVKQDVAHHKKEELI